MRPKRILRAWYWRSLVRRRCGSLSGGDERPAFIEQARGLGRAWQAPVEVKLELHHFDVFDGLADPDSAIMASLLG